MGVPRATADDGLRLYRSFVAAREIDRLEAELVRRGEAFFHVSGAGHETSAALAPHLTPHDWLHCHYRDKALLIHRGLALRQFFDSLLCTDHSNSRGRQMSAHLCDRTLRVLSIVGPVGNNALQAVGIAAEIRGRPERAIVICSVGDGTTQEGEFLEAVAEAVRERLPVLFLIHDNRWAISSPTRGRSFFSRPNGDAGDFYGLTITRVDGRDPLAAYDSFSEVVSGMRESRAPAIIWLDAERLCDHTNSDDQRGYRTAAELEAAARADPLGALADQLLSLGVQADELARIEADVHQQVAAAAELAAASPAPRPVFTAKAPIPNASEEPKEDGLPRPAGSDDGSVMAGKGHLRSRTMREALCKTLRYHLQTDPRVFLFGQDIEDPKGDVFGVTRGLSTAFPGRVRNAPLSEATIIGTSIGRALAGARPIAFLQFADFLPLAYNQILSELASMHWRTDGAWHAPVIVMIACGGYRPGLGPFHAQTLESIAAHTPGIDVVMPSTAADAAGLLDAAFGSGRPTLFFYPKARLNDDSAARSDAGQVLPLGRARLVSSGSDLSLVAWGNTVELCERTAASIAEIGFSADVLDLRSLSPWDKGAVIASSEKTGRLIVVHEDNHTCGFGAEVAATVAEKAAVPVRIRRVTRADTFVPCHFGSQLEVLPSYQRVLTAAAELLGLDLTWHAGPEDDVGFYTIDAIGSGPTDETIVISEINVEPGDHVQVGDVVAIAEAAKSVIDVCSTVAGTVVQVFAAPGETLPVGQPLARIRTAEHHRKPITCERGDTPVFSFAPRQLKGVPLSPAARLNGDGFSHGHLRASPKGDHKAAYDAAESIASKSPRRLLLGRRFTQSVGVPAATLSRPIDWQQVVEVTARRRSAQLGAPLTEFDVVAYAVAQATAAHSGFRTTISDDGTLAQSPFVHLGVAVHLTGDDLTLAVVRNANRLAVEEFAAALEVEIAAAMNGKEALQDDVCLVITYLGGLSATDAVPLLVSPATGVLFIGSPYATPEGRRVKLCLTFDHRIVNGVAAARFLEEIARQIECLNGSEPHFVNEARSRGWLVEHLSITPASERLAMLQGAIIELVCNIVKTGIGPASDHQNTSPEANGAVPAPQFSRAETLSRGYPTSEPLRHLGLGSLAAVELSARLGDALDITLPAALIWSYPTISSVAAHLLARLELPGTESPRAACSNLDPFEGDLLSKITKLTPAQAAELVAYFLNDGS